jgi:hypothetical protein
VSDHFARIQGFSEQDEAGDDLTDTPGAVLVIGNAGVWDIPAMESEKIVIVGHEDAAFGVATGKHVVVRESKRPGFGSGQCVNTTAAQRSGDSVREMFVELVADSRHRLCPAALQLRRKRAEFVLA